MTAELMKQRRVLDKTPVACLLREMIGFSVERHMSFAQDTPQAASAPSGHSGWIWPGNSGPVPE